VDANGQQFEFNVQNNSMGLAGNPGASASAPSEANFKF